MDSLTRIGEGARQVLETRCLARDQALMHARQLTRHAAHTIRAIHRNEVSLAHEHLDQARELVIQLKTNLSAYPDLYYAGYTQDAIKEFAEATITCALIQNEDLPGPQDIDVETATYLNGLAEAAGELRRRCLDILRQGYSIEAERMLTSMDEIYSLLVTLDFPEAVTNGLRRQTDAVRGIVERTRGDLTMSLRQQELQQQLENFMNRLNP